jgi:hypothetical protein
MEIILSLLGSEVLSEGGSATGKNVAAGTGVPGTAGTGTTSDAPKAVQWPPTIVSVRSLLEGVSNSNITHTNTTSSESSKTKFLSVYSCTGTGEFDCDRIATKNLSASDFPGTHEYITEKILGLNGVYIAGNGSLLDKLLNCKTEESTTQSLCGFTAEQKAIIGFTSAPVLSLLKRGQGKADTTETIARLLIPLIAEDYTVRMMEGVVAIANEAYMDVELSMPEGVKQRLQLITTELQQTKLNYLDRHQKQNALTQFVTQLLAEAPGMWVTLPSSVGIRR